MPPPDERTAEQIKELLRPKFWQAFQSAVMVTLPFGMVEYALAAKLLPAAALTNQPLLLFRTIGSLVVYGTAFSHVYAAWFDADAETGL